MATDAKAHCLTPGGAGPQVQRSRPPQGTSRASWALTHMPPTTAPPHPHMRSTALRLASSSLQATGSRRTARPTTATCATSSSATTSTVERRAADVAVLGDSCVALAAAYSFARRGKKVVLLPDLGLAAPRAPPELFRPLHLPHPDAAMVSLASDAAAYWRGLQAQAAGSGLQLLTDCRSLDLGPMRGGGGAGGAEEAGEVLGRLQDACRAAGVRLGSLRNEELSALFPALRLPGGVAGLLQPEGGVLNGAAVRSLLLDLGKRQGVMLRDRLVLRGWRDAGSHFVLRASGSLLPGAVSVFEVEQLVLAPGPEGWPGHVLRLFGADVRALQVLQSSFARCSAAPELAKLPVWRTLGIPPPTSSSAAASSAPAAPRGAPEQLHVVSGLPARLAAPGSSSASLKLGLGLAPGPAEELGPWAWRLDAPDRSGLLSAHRLASGLLRGVGPPLLPPPDSAPSPDSTTGTSAEAGAEQSWGSVALHAATPDGWPALGFLPGLEPGRLLFVSTASCCSNTAPASPTSSPTLGEGAAKPTGPSGSSGSARSGTGSAGGQQHQQPQQPDAGSEQQQQQQQPPQPSQWLLGGRPVLADGYQLSPLLAKMAVDLMCGAARPAEVEWERLDLGRAALGAVARVEGLDPWDGLGGWQSGEAFRREAAAARGETDAQEARERAEAVARGARMVGADAGAEDAAAREAEERRRGAGPKVFTIKATP